MQKRNLFARTASSLGALMVLETLARRDCLMILNYHRIGDRYATEFDEGMFAATAEGLEEQVKYLRKKYSVITLDEAVDLVVSNKGFRGVAVLITFDDGYADNYHRAFPVLHSLGVQGTFFLVSSYLSQPVVPWWEKIAYWVRNCPKETLRIAYPEPAEFFLPPGRRSAVINQVLHFFKSPKTTDGARFLAELEQECAVRKPFRSDSRLFMTWEMAAEMARAGMGIGSHTKSHPILSKLSRADQLKEVKESRELLSSRLGVPIQALAYPVGARTSFNQDTVSALREAGYRAAFSYYGGLNRMGRTSCFDIQRFAIETEPFFRFRLQVALGVASDGYWF